MTPVILFFVLFTASFSRAAAAAEQSWSAEVVIQESSAIPGDEINDGHIGSPSLLRLDDGRLFLSYMYHGGDGIARIAYKVMDNNGIWGPAQTIPGTELGLDPSATQLPDGRVMVAYAHYMDGIYKIAVNTVKSTGGSLNNWLSPEEVVSPLEKPPGSNTFDNAFVPAISTLENGRVLIAYSWGHETDYSDVRLITSSDGGSSWNPGSALVYGGPLYDSKASLIELDNGELLCGFYTSPSFAGPDLEKNGDIHTVRSVDGGATWGGFVTLSNQEQDESWVSLLQLGGGEIYAAFSIDEGDMRPDLLPSIKIMKSADRGASWGEGQVWRSSERISWPTLVQKPDGAVVIVADNNGWYDWLNRSSFSLRQISTTGSQVSISLPPFMSTAPWHIAAAATGPATGRAEFYLDGSPDPFAVMENGQGGGGPGGTFTTNLPSGIAAGWHVLLVAAYDGNKTGVSSRAFQVPDVTQAPASVYWGSYHDYNARMLSVDYEAVNHASRRLSVWLSRMNYLSAGVTLTTALPYGISGSLAPGAVAPFTPKYVVPQGVASFRHDFQLDSASR